jgi:RNase P/RNase MRP subunit p29
VRRRLAIAVSACRKHSGQLKSERQACKLHGGLSPVAAIRQALSDGSATYESIKAALHVPWQAYVQRLLPPGACPAHQMQCRVSTCSWLGAAVSVTASRHAQHVGKVGIAVWVSDKLLHVLSPGGRVACVERALSDMQVSLPEGLLVAGRSSITLRGAKCP